MRPKKILIIEDNQDIADLLVEFITYYDGQAYWCSSTMQAEHVMNDYDFDLLICDNDLEQRDDGLSFCDMLANRGCKASVVLYTGRCPERVPRIEGRLIPVILKPHNALLERYMLTILNPAT